ncbi:hypothetical protein NBO_1464g0002 [Nosema bombycis CQ1]|uniref:Uncharacterized protein n=1 Tax=Nosema bombycis (strain CQ1 / CVCC 102059) TaxID=578461 RepID=R0KM17_NOSB1|nr:hypothetical protein NBO_1464g0002 [Nosema bombycis CQ1]|eukprot:EOB11197.1 hypothetical protein NBO_1464g0002 [Nosema bombycis CQ1]
MIFFVTQGEDLLEGMNYIKGPESIEYSISQYKNNVYSISNDKKTHYLSKGLSVVVKDKFLFDEPIATFKLIFEIFILNSNSGFKDSIYLSNAFFMRGKSYKIMLFSSSELMVLIKKYISNRIHNIVASYDCVSIEDCHDILANFVNSSIL